MSFLDNPSAGLEFSSGRNRPKRYSQRAKSYENSVRRRKLRAGLETLEDRMLLANDTLAAMLEPVQPPEFLIYRDDVTGDFAGPSETDTIPLPLDGGQKLSLVFSPQSGTVAGTVRLLDAVGGELGSVSGGAGETLVLADINIAVADDYVVSLANSAGTGSYHVSIVLNGTPERESNNTLGTATSITGSSVSLPGTADRLGAVGELVDTEADYFSFTLTAGVPTSLAMQSTGGAKLTLLDATDTALASGVNGEQVSQVIAGFVPSTSGTYYARVDGGASGGSESYSLTVVRDSEISSEPNDDAPAAQNIDLTQQVVGALGGSASGTSTGTIRVGVFNGSFTYPATVVAQLNDDTYFDFDASLVLAADVDTLEDLDAFDVIVMGEQSAAITTQAATAIRDWNAAGRGGVLGTGWLMYNVNSGNSLSIASRSIIDEFIPLQLTGSRTVPSGNISITDLNHPVTDGLSSTLLYTGAHDLSTTGADADAQVLGNISGSPAIIVRENGPVRNAYLGPSYFSNYGTTTGDMDRLFEQTVAWVAASDAEDHYLFTATAGDNLTLSTTTPGDANRQPANDLDPAIDLYFVDGGSPNSVIASNGDFGGSHNALVSYTVPTSGLYRAVVRKEVGSGAYTFNVAGATGATGNFQVAASTPADLQPVNAYPTFRVELSSPVLLTSLQASDLTVNGIAASSFTLVDGQTIDFDISSADTGDGSYAVQIAAGALTDIAGNSLVAFSSTFSVDTTPPTVVSFGVTEGDVLTTANIAFDVEFSEDLSEVDLGPEDVLLVENFSGATFVPQTFVYSASTDLLSLAYSGLPQGDYSLTLRSLADGFADLVGNLLDGNADGNGGDDATVNFAVDYTDAFSSLQPILPAGSLIYDSFGSGALHDATDTDSFTIALSAGQTLSVLAIPVDNAQLQIDFGAENASATAAGLPALLQTAPVPSDATYSVDISSLAGDGRYELRIFLNAAVEEEEVFAVGNNDQASAEDLDNSAVALSGGASRLAVVGSFDGGGIIPGDDEPNDEFSEATQTCFFVGEGCTFDGYSGAIGDNPAFTGQPWLDVDIYSAGLFSGQSVVIDVDAQVNGSPLDSYVRVFDSFGNELASNDDENGGESGVDSFLFFTAPSSGTYYIGVSSLDNNDYDPTSAGSGSATGGESTLGFYDLYISDVGGVSLAGGSPFGDDVYRFTLAAGVPATVVLTSLDGQGNLLLCDDAGNLLASGIGGHENVDQSIVDFTSATGGTFYVHVSAALESDYSLVITRGATFDLEQNSDVANSQSIGNTGQVLGSVGGQVPTGLGAVGSTNLPVTLVDGGGYSWDIQGDGRIGGSVTGDPVDSGFDLSGLPFLSTGTTHQAGREVVHGPSFFNAGLTATRSVYVPEGSSFARFLDVFTNSTNQTINTSAFYFSNVDLLTIEGTSSGDTELTTDDYWLITDDNGGGDHAFAHIVGGPGGVRPSSFSTSGDSINWSFELSVAPGESVALLSFGIQDVFSDETIIANSAEALATLSGDVLDGLTGEELDAIINFSVQSSDSYFFDVTAATTLTLTTTTPGAGPGQPANSLDPTIELYYMDGATPDIPVASDSATGNANLPYVVDGAALGRYRVVVKGAASRGEFTLNVDSSVAGAVGDNDPFEIVASTPEDGAALQSINRFRVDLSHGALISSVVPGDLTFSGPGTLSATDVIAIDGDTLEFVLDNSGATDGTYTATFAAGVLTSLSGDLSEAYSISFMLDGTNPTVISSTITDGQVLPTGDITFSAVFSEDLDSTDIGPEDIGLYDSISDTFYSAVSGAYSVGTRTYTANFVNLPEGLYSLFLFSGAFRDLVGNALDGNGDGSSNGSGADNFVVNFATDTNQAFSVPFGAVVPDGSLIYESTTLGVAHGAGDVDVLSVELDAGQTATIIVQSDATLRSGVELFAPGGGSVGSASASVAGELIVLQTLPVASAGVYEIAVTSLAGAGAYDVQVYLNAVAESETLLGTTNDTTASAQAIDGSSIGLAGTAGSRMGAVGQVGNEKLVEVTGIGWVSPNVDFPRAFTYAGAGRNRLYMANGNFSEVSLDGSITFLGSMDHTSNGLARVGSNLYSVAGFETSLFGINPVNGATISAVGVTVDGAAVNGFNGLATDPTTGTLYAIVRPNGSSTNVRFLATIDVTTGVATIIGDMGNRFSGIAFGNDGTLYSATGNSATPDHTLFEVDKTNAASELLAPLPTLNGGGQALAFNSDNGLLYRGAGSGSGADFQSIAITEIVDAVDVYSVALQAGDIVTLAATGGGGVHLELLDGAGDLIALGASSPTNTDSIVRDFLVPTSGNYFARLSSPGGRTDYSLLVTSGIGFEVEPNNEVFEASFVGPTNSVLGSAGSSASIGNGGSGSTNLPLNLSDGSGLLWDIQRDGNINNGSSDAFDGGFRLSGFGSFNTGVTEQDGREVAIGPSTISGLNATRKIYVPTDENFARFLDSFTNTSGTTINATIGYSTNLGSDSGTIALATSSGDTVLTNDDSWIVTDDGSSGGGDPAVAHIVSGAGFLPTSFARSGDNVSWTQNISVAPGATVSLLYFGIQNFNRTTTLEGAAALSAAPVESLVGLSESELSSIANWALATADNYLIGADANATLTISTTTPGDQTGEFVNGFDPVVELYYVDGATPEVIVATDDNSASDGRNAVLTYTVPADAAGTYRVLIRGVDSRGEYTLNVSGANGTHAFTASAVGPTDGQLLSDFPATFQIEFNQDLLLSSVDPADLRVNGSPATGVTIIDGSRLEFDIASLAGGDGVYTVTISPGAITSVSGEPIQFFSSTFDADTTSPTVIASSLTPGSVVGPGSLSYQATFSESLETVGLGAEDVVLVSSTGLPYAVDAFAYDDATRTITASFVGLPEDDYTLTLISSADAFRDRRGNLLDGGPSFPLPSGDGTTGDDFVVSFSVDVGTTLFPTPLDRIGPEGGLIFGGFANGVIAPSSDVDAFSIELEAGQLITLNVLPFAAGLRPVVELKGPGGATLATGTAAAAGQQAVVQVVPTVTGNYTIAVRSADGTSGSYGVAAYLNAQLETESITGASNNTSVNAESLAGSSLLLDGTAERVAILGMSDDENDYYRYALAAGQTSTIAVMPLTGSIGQLELLSPAGASLAVGILSDSGQVTIRSFTAAVSGEYLLRVRGGTATQYALVATRDADLDLEPNDDLSSAQPMIGSQLISGSLQSSGAGFQADFSDNSGNLSLDGFTATGLWHVTDATACGADLPGHSAPNIAYFGLDASCSFNAGRVAGTLTSPSLSLRADSSPELRLNYRFGGEGGTTFDRTEVRVSTDGGATFTIVAGKAAFPATNVWTAKVVDLSAYAGQTIVLQFWFDSIDSVANSGLGWQIDDLEVTGVTDTQDHYSFFANEGDELTITTQTPGDQTGQPENNLDPVIELYSSAGLLLISDSNSAADGRNAQLTYTVPAGVGNKFIVRVAGQSAAGGGYLLSVAGSTGNNQAAPTVTSVLPTDGQPLAVAPANLVFTFSEGILASSLEPADLVFADSSVTVTSVEMLDGQTVSFSLSIANAVGEYTYSLAAGTLLDLQGQGNEAFAGSFVVDRQGPNVVTTNPATQASAPFTSLTFVFNEFLDIGSISIADDVISFTGPGGAIGLSEITSISLNGNLLTVGFNAQTSAGTYTMKIGPRIADLVGNLMDQDGDGIAGEVEDTYTATLTLQSPDLTVTSATTDAAAQFGDVIDVTYTVNNIGTDPASEGWTDAIYLSTDAILDRDDVLLKRIPNSGQLGPLDAAGGSNPTYTY
ncbi:MAG: pre-peptidase C-terminal domain-containing protein [Pirellulaceae bacterium]